jgi:transcriptional regulator with XRE-family HTH domain
MHGDIEQSIRKNLQDREYAEEYAASFLNSYIATQIKVIREQRGLTQAELGVLVGTTQAGVSRYENVNYSSWSLKTLVKLAHAFAVRLKVSFEPYGTLADEVIRFDRQRLERIARENDPGIFIQQDQTRGEPCGVVDLGEYKALQGTDWMSKENMGGDIYGSHGNHEGKSSRDVGTGCTYEHGKSSSFGLYSAVGGQV